MLAAISQRNDKNGDLVDSLENNYVNYLEKFGIKLIIIPNTLIDIDSYLEGLPIQAVILTGGNTPHPDLYGGKIREGSFSKQRDATEKRLLEIAVDKKLPVLGICRGMQFINLFFGGKILDIMEEMKEVIEHAAVTHPIEIIGNQVVNLLGNKIEVNSYHNYAITNEVLGSGLKSFAQTSDGVIEGLYHPSLPIAGIEWHPERKSPDEGANEKIVKAFVNRGLFWK